MAEVPDLAVDLARIKPSGKHDLVPRMTPFLDPHMLFPLLGYLKELQVYDEKSMAAAEFALASKTCMIEYTIKAFEGVHGEGVAVPQELVEREAAIGNEYRRRLEAAAPILDVIDDGEGQPSATYNDLRRDGNFTPEFLFESYGLTPDIVEALYDFARYRFDCGEYAEAAFYLGVYRDLGTSSPERFMHASWGRLAGFILSMAWADADEMINTLRSDMTGSRTAGSASRFPRLSDAELLQQRTWLLHWSLFVFANYPEVKGDATAGTGMNRGGREKLVEAFMEEPNLTAIQLNCPWLLRYVTAAVLTSSDKRRQAHLRSLLRVVSQEGGAAADPIVDFVASVLLRFDFDGAQAKLAECESVIVTDFFLSYLTSAQEFMEAARLFIFETYCRIHQKIDLPMLASKLHLEESAAEKWVVELIRTAALEAKIDSATRQVVMVVPVASVYTQVYEKTRDLVARTRALAEGVDAAVLQDGAREDRETRERERGGGGGRGGHGGGGGGGAGYGRER